MGIGLAKLLPTFQGLEERCDLYPGDASTGK